MISTLCGGHAECRGPGLPIKKVEDRWKLPSPATSQLDVAVVQGRALFAAVEHWAVDPNRRRRLAATQGRRTGA